MEDKSVSKKLISDIRRLCEISRFDEALSLIQRAEKESDLSPTLLVLKGCLIQLSDGGAYNLSDAEEAYKDSLSLNNNDIEALIELAWFYFAVYDDAHRATPLFEQVINLCSDWMTDAIIGKAKCLAETQSKESAVKFLQSYPKLDIGKIRDLEAELREQTE